MKTLPRLGVNIDHIATIRNARGGEHPDPVAGAYAAIQAGADGITAHLREDRRHMRDEDMTRLQMLCESQNIPLNMEMAATPDMLAIALNLKPKAICIVPERREERTTEGGLDVASGHNQIEPITRALKENGSRVSLFIEATEVQIRAAASTAAEVVEFHTGAYAHALDDGDQAKADAYIEAFKKSAKLADELGLEVHFGHGLTFDNVAAIAVIPECMELNIGHFIIGEAVFMGLEAAITEMRRVVTDARAS
ncbi:pyridoxine 5'-phosphate synthase [Litorimonas cladophorae]|uniref:Pyridoxine 5'-phosphate synthase n=1 Tax=Litorimonas cladophorae TaxID=1220491 RepID=A0A918KEX6_9PROT|nr:pyridoxine 5'-phosphate synthase [Litorimonas cladophorae]GGX59282.1 pyridoxine 5'-phosphate synthase [Litorimonas cladophorae]